MSALTDLAGGRGDLLAEVAGILEGTAEGELNEDLVCQAAELCRKAGADESAIPAWIEEGPPQGGQRPGAAAVRRHMAAR